MKKYQINLLKKKEVGLIDKFIYFSLHYLRYIIVITQIVVIGVFFFRIMVDQEIVDLKEAVDQKQEIVRVTFLLVEEAEAVEQRTSEAKRVLEKQGVFTDNLNYVFSTIPAGVVLNNFEASEKFIKLTGFTLDSGRVRFIYQKLKEEQQFKEVILNQIVKSNLGFEFSITIAI